MNEMKLSNGTVLDTYTAVGLAEGFVEMDNLEEKDYLMVWSFIGKHGLHRTLQGWFGRSLKNLVDSGYLDNYFNIV